jgi:hypothetical protein
MSDYLAAATESLKSVVAAVLPDGFAVAPNDEINPYSFLIKRYLPRRDRDRRSFRSGVIIANVFIKDTVEFTHFPKVEPNPVNIVLRMEEPDMCKQLEELVQKVVKDELT